MIAVVQRVSSAAVTVEGEPVGRIGRGILVLLGVEAGDAGADAAWLARKIAGLRVFRDPGGGPERSVRETGGACLVVSQFTLLGNCRKGRRPSFTRAARGPEAEGLYDRFCALLRAEGVPVATGRFGAMMEVALVNHGPYTLIVTSPMAAARRAAGSAPRG